MMAMDLIASPTAVLLQAPISSSRTPDSDPDTPPPSTQPNPKWVHQNHRHALPDLAVVSYKECLKNHAASIGGHALDGCCEFMPGPTFNPLDPTSLKCAACGCHRNFHRRDPDDPTPLHHHLPSARAPHSPSSASQLLLSLRQTTTTTTPHYDHQEMGIPNRGQNGNYYSHSGSSNNKKRFRTKFSQEQKEKMMEFSEKIGWKLRRGEEKLVEDFCKGIGVGRGVFKVWMHNNKHSSLSLKKDKGEVTHSINNGGSGININNNIINNNNNNNNNNGVHGFYVNGEGEEEQEQEQEHEAMEQ